MRNLVDVTLTIYEPGYTCAREQIEDADGIWLTPVNYPSAKGWIKEGYAGDCLRELTPQERRIEPRWGRTFVDSIFDSWAVLIEFNFVPDPGIASGQWWAGLGYVNHLAFEVYNSSLLDVFAPDIEPLLEMLDRHILKLCPQDAPVHHVRALAAWQVNYHRSYGMDGDDIDTEIYFEGLVKNVVLEVAS